MDKLENIASVKSIVIIGGGFAGTNLALKMAKDKHYDITLVDINNYNVFIPLIYQVATGFLETSSVSYPFRRLFRGKNNVHFRLGTFIRVDSQAHTCYLDNGKINYDYLVFAKGSVSNYFNNENFKLNSIPMKTLADALNMRNTLLKTLEQASLETDPTKQSKLLNLVVAGGGPTGVEVSGMIGELRNYVIDKDYPELCNVKGYIYLIEGAPRLLVGMSDKTHTDAFNALTKLGINIKLSTRVKDYKNGKVILSDGDEIETPSLIWAAGVTIQPIEGLPIASTGRSGRILVDAFNKVEGVDDIYAIGDICIQLHEKKYPNGHPQLAQVAIQQGKNLALNFSLIAKVKHQRPFAYFDKGTMAIIGRKKAVVDLAMPAIHLKGFLALLVWLFIHLMGLINYRNKLSTFINWFIAYIITDLPLRMIIKPTNKEP